MNRTACYNKHINPATQTQPRTKKQILQLLNCSTAQPKTADTTKPLTQNNKTPQDNYEPNRIFNYKCPNCEWTITTPFGKEDLTDHIALHNQKHHNATLRARISKSELIKLQK